MASITLYVGIHRNQYDTSVMLHTSETDANAFMASTARTHWTDRADQTADPDHSKLTDDDVVSAYFDTNRQESYDVIETTVGGMALVELQSTIATVLAKAGRAH